MPGHSQDAPAGIVFGPFEVSTDNATVSAFARFVGAAGGHPPATFPIVWLSHPSFKAALRAALGPGFLPVHESQSFHYERPLKLDGRYVLSGVARREFGPDRLVVVADAVGPDGRVALTLRTVLRIVAVGGDA